MKNSLRVARLNLSLPELLESVQAKAVRLQELADEVEKERRSIAWRLERISELAPELRGGEASVKDLDTRMIADTKLYALRVWNFAEGAQVKPAKPEVVRVIGAEEPEGEGIRL